MQDGFLRVGFDYLHSKFAGFLKQTNSTHDLGIEVGRNTGETTGRTKYYIG